MLEEVAWLEMLRHTQSRCLDYFAFAAPKGAFDQRLLIQCAYISLWMAGLEDIIPGLCTVSCLAKNHSKLKSLLSPTPSHVSLSLVDFVYNFDHFHTMQCMEMDTFWPGHNIVWYAYKHLFPLVPHHKSVFHQSLIWYERVRKIRHHLSRIFHSPAFNAAIRRLNNFEDALTLHRWRTRLENFEKCEDLQLWAGHWTLKTIVKFGNTFFK